MRVLIAVLSASMRTVNGGFSVGRELDSVGARSPDSVEVSAGPRQGLPLGAAEAALDSFPTDATEDPGLGAQSR